MLDGPLEAELLAGNLDDLERLNRLLGGAELSWRALAALSTAQAGRPLSLLDVGTGSADIPRQLLRRAQASGRRLRITATDVRAVIVDHARRRSAGHAGLAVVLATEGPLDFADDSFDVVHASLVLHHLEPPAAAAALAEMARVARLAVIINDLDRRGRWWLAAWTMTRLLTRNRYTRHDAPLSVRRAYRPAEVVELAAPAGLREADRLWARPGYRYALVLVGR
jgi:ubiquinone/menaquinone biosynthesis C-methylase UbiE